MEIRELDVADAAARHAEGDVLFMDVRDEGSYRAAHVPGAVHVSDASIAGFLEQTDKQATVVVYCYHGNASRGGAAYLMQHGFLDVYSMRGGFEAWRGRQPQEAG